MAAIRLLRQSISKVGIKEVARRSGLSPSTISRIHSLKINPSLDVVERICAAVGLNLVIQRNNGKARPPRLAYALDVIGRLRNELKSLGVAHAVIYGSVARSQDNEDSDIDVFLDFGAHKPRAVKLLKAEGIVLDAFGENKIDVVSDLSSPRGQRLKLQIDRDGVCVF